MAITVAEQFGRRLSGDRGELGYLITGTTDAGEARTALLEAAPTAHGGLPRVDGEVDEMPGLQQRGGAFLGRVSYGYGSGSAPPEPEDSTFSFDTGGGTQHITQSLATIGKYAPPDQTAPDFQGAIGVTKDGVQGVDITVPVYQWSETHYFTASQVTEAYKAKLSRLTGSANNATFKGFQAGEVLFLGARGSRPGDDPADLWQIAFSFAASKNATGLTVGPITGINKKGWEYLWVLYREAEDEDAKALVQRPIAAYVEQVLLLDTFADLQIGSS